MAKKQIRLNESSLRNVIVEAVSNFINNEWNHTAPREEWVETFGEEYVQRMEDPVGRFLEKAEKELGSVINFGVDYDGSSSNPLAYINHDYCESGKARVALRSAMWTLNQYDMISINDESQAINVEDSNHQELAQELQNLLSQYSGINEAKKISREELNTIIAESIRTALAYSLPRSYDDWRTREPDYFGEPEPDFCINLEDNPNLPKEAIETFLQRLEKSGTVSSFDFDDTSKEFSVYASYEEGPDGSEYEEGGRYPRNFKHVKTKPHSLKRKLESELTKQGIEFYEV